jgi:hypothetical protein
MTKMSPQIIMKTIKPPIIPPAIGPAFDFVFGFTGAAEGVADAIGTVLVVDAADGMLLIFVVDDLLEVGESMLAVAV